MSCGAERSSAKLPHGQPETLPGIVDPTVPQQNAHTRVKARPKNRARKPVDKEDDDEDDSETHSPTVP